MHLFCAFCGWLCGDMAEAFKLLLDPAPVVRVARHVARAARPVARVATGFDADAFIAQASHGVAAAGFTLAWV
jgi:hypothetical protein